MFSAFNQSSATKQNSVDLNGSHLSNLGTPLDQSTPAFLFGKRKGTAPTTYTNSPLNTTSAPCADIFAFPSPAAVPSHVKDTPGSKSVHWSPALVSEKPTTPSHTPNVSFGSVNSAAHAIKPLQTSSFGGQALNAPPLRSLRDKIEPAKKIARRNTFAARSTPSSTPNTQRITSRLANTDEQAEEDTDAAETWVTVFGFAPAQVSLLLNLFSRHGEVVSHQAPTQGNCMHIRYSCITHAQQALSRNATFLDQYTIIGVIPCTAKDVINGSAAGIVARTSTNAAALSMYNSFVDGDAAKQSANHNENSMLNSSNVFDANASLNSSRISVRSGVGMRPLAADQRPNGTPAARRQPDGLLNKFWNTIGLN